MLVHHLSCGCMCPVGGALFDGFSKGATACLVCHCLLIETAREGLVLVDTGFGRRDLSRSASSISPFFRTLNNIRFDERLSALTQIEQLGYRAEDVRHIVLTHLDFDHAGGLGDFPDATVHLLAEEKAHAEAPGGGFINRRRYIDRHWQGVRHWQPYAAQGESWKGFAAVKALIGCEAEDIYLVPLRGHTLGHAGVAVAVPGGWLLHAGDAYFYRGEIGYSQRHCTPGLRFYQWMMEADAQARAANQQRLRQAALTQPDLRIFCSHDAQEFARLSGRSVLADGTVIGNTAATGNP
ncbi:hypothetical protein TUM18999_35510 [Pseudomonas tohonis]|uniref:Metallo-beta-lactamase domain-containing protein n=1 Tax=Pseudomonas tohonis TaxID=2725477 RepID=A0A6J4E6X1_9PSED|nr:MBL fold metallo-hydrolase [Pseudomonas tohonis]BCG25360.1 hypothetical protein TUM18999_35510 [Pseudomonas tohonis]GJN54810.1 hypothetical protein TUM20286_45620 [Pseudomonas tohonis]